ncbi:MAG: hypothetical protein U1A27_03430 [Phycisphaerae bacterium]
MGALPGVLMAAYGWLHPFLEAGAAEVSYNLSVQAINFALRFGGPALILVAGLQMFGAPRAALIEGAVGALFGGIMAAVGLYWVVVSLDINAIILLVFGSYLLRHGIVLLRAEWPGAGAEPDTGEEEIEVAPPVDRPPPAPRASSQPAPEEPPPADGYLAQLGRAKRERRATERQDGPHDAR